MGPDIVIATPGRLIDHLHNAPNFSLASIEILVLDEADRFVCVYIVLWEQLLGLILCLGTHSSYSAHCWMYLAIFRIVD